MWLRIQMLFNFAIDCCYQKIHHHHLLLHGHRRVVFGSDGPAGRVTMDLNLAGEFCWVGEFHTTGPETR